MAQTSSATREPSMEEILASIRRIIEDSDVTKQAAAELSTAPVPQSMPEEKRGEVAQFPRVVADTAQTETDSGVSSQPPLSIDAVLRGTLQDTAPSTQHNAEQQAAEQHERNVAHVRIAAVNPPVPPVVHAVTERVKPDPLKASEALLMHVAEKRVAVQSTASTKEEVAPVSDQTESNPFEKPLISRAAEEQVSASFGSLSQALMDEQKRLLNEKMEAMLRPMLQEWLDKNLPSLVERLVREEIERVVRRG